MKRVLSLLLCLVLVLSLCLSVSAADWDNPFCDVREGQWFYEGVRYVTEAGLFAGMSNTTFGPGVYMTRAMLVTVLWRHAGQPEAGRIMFTDVSGGQWYFQAVAWAAENKIVSGVGNSKFDPNGNITREQLATILYRYGTLLGMDAYKGANLFVYPDYDRISEYAELPMCWAVANGILSGVAQGSQVWLQPKGNATRAQVALMLKNFVAALEAEGCTPELPVAPENKMTLGGNELTLGMPESAMLALCGAPVEKLPAFRGFTWYVYGTDTYENFYMVGIDQGKVAALCGAGPGFRYAGMKAGDALIKFSEPDDFLLNAYTDQNAGDTLHCVLLVAADENRSWHQKNEYAYYESRVIFHLTNAFRVLYGEPVLVWSDKAAEAARLHSQDMSDNNSFSHEGSNGSRAGQRLTDAGVIWSAWGENIAYGYADGVSAYNGWVNSDCHRENMLTSGYTHLGVGTSANSGMYYTQDFYR